jgi:sister-chromatid-cohesion protein PDS5
MDPQTDLKGLVKAQTEFIKKLSSSHSALVPTLLPLMQKASLGMINTSSIPTLLYRLQKGTQAAGAAAKRRSTMTITHAQLAAESAQLILEYIAKHNPELFKSHIGELVKALASGGAKTDGTSKTNGAGGDVDMDDNDSVDEASGKADSGENRVVGIALRALAAVVRWDKGLAPVERYVFLPDHSCSFWDPRRGLTCVLLSFLAYFTFRAPSGPSIPSRTIERIRKHALGSDLRHAKFAARFLAFTKNSRKICGEVVEVDFVILSLPFLCSLVGVQTIVNSLHDAEPAFLAAHVTVLAQLARFAPDAIEEKSEEIVTFLMRNLLMVPSEAVVCLFLWY